MSRVKVTCAYDGTAYRGWQRQDNANSVQSILENMLSKLHKHTVEITASGRTDAEVHAIGQVFHFDTDKDIDEAHWKQAMNSMLPKEIRIKKVEIVDASFHARFSAMSKRYDYLISNDIDNPFLQHYMALEKQTLDVPYMQACAAVFLGTHDFTSFTSAKIDPRKPRVKTITRLEVIQESHCIRLIFEGTGFLRYMVRMIAQTLIEAGKHRIEIEEVRRMLEMQDKHVCRYKAVACGLYLVSVTYGGEGNEGELSYPHDTLSSCDRQ